MNTLTIVRALPGLAAAGLVLAAGCSDQTPRIDTSDPQQAAFARMLMPKSIKVQPFTKVQRLQGEGPPDGIEVVVAALDRQGDEMKAIGTYFFELYEFRPASGDPKGGQVASWEVKVDSDQAMATYWDKPSPFFRFPLKLPGSTLPPGRYILAVRFVSPWEEKLFDEYEFTHEAPPDQTAG